MAVRIYTTDTLAATVREAVQSQPVLDIHTHLYGPEFGDLFLWGIDQLLTYHYLIAETLRTGVVSPEEFWRMDQTAQAELIWKTLFLERAPISEACRGVVTTLQQLGLDPADGDLEAYRDFYRSLDPQELLDRVFRQANVEAVVMTNDPFDPRERSVWMEGKYQDRRFLPALRIDPLVNDYAGTWSRLAEWGYGVDPELSEAAAAEVRRFLADWVERMDPLYMAVSLPPDFAYPEDSLRGRVIRDCILPTAEEFQIPFALMIGVKRRVNPALRLAGDGVGRADLSAVERLCVENPSVRFLVTVLARENQHELVVLGRKFPNLMVFGCWWFVNNPSIIEEITRERVEMLGWSFIPQHSDARILDQLLYKWPHSREVIARVLIEKYTDLLRSGWVIDREEIRRDVAKLFRENFVRFLGRSLPSD